MSVPEAIDLIYLPELMNPKPQIWADLGCGSGLFTRALIQILPSESRILAIDRAPQKINLGSAVSFLQADFEYPLFHLPLVDGILMANSLHFILDKLSLIKHLAGFAPKFIIVEYETSFPNPWVPFPISFKDLKILFERAGFRNISKVNEQTSVYGGKMYAAHIS